MPSIDYNKKGGIITCDSRDWEAGITLLSKNTVGYQSGSVDPLRDRGYIQPSFTTETLDNSATVTDTLRSGVIYGSDGYCISEDAKIQKIDNMALPDIETTGFPHSITHGAHSGLVGSDAVTYYVSGVPYLFYSFYDGTDWDVGRFDFSSTFDDDFMSTVPTTPLADNWGGDADADYLTGGANMHHPMKVGDDDILYIGSGRYLHAYDGSTNTFWGAVLTLPSGYRITCLETMPNNKLAIGAYYDSATGSTYQNRGFAKVYVWGYSELDPDYIVDLNDNYISNLTRLKDNVLAFTYGNRSSKDGGDYKIKTISGESYSTINEWNSSFGYIPIHHGTVVNGDNVYMNIGSVCCLFKNDYGKYGISKLFGSGEAGLILPKSTNLGFVVSSGAYCYQAYREYNSGEILLNRIYPSFPDNMKGEIIRVSVTFKETFSNIMEVSVYPLSGSIPVIYKLNTYDKIKYTIYNNEYNDSELNKFTYLDPLVSWGNSVEPGADNTKCPILEKIEIEYKLINN